ncbi:MAG: Carbamoyl-phosphate synthase large chain [Candidatus Dichloromethanomonas elyunquensis]|nr:MAG: Carbamoyl-phosphate synthase large chain [Candidatus Dichloromethanomonas elyunquensis]
MPKQNWQKVMVIGSGPIVIGQAAEFDYAGTQACRALREEGVETVLVNSNPATIMTDREVADKVYIEPLTVEFLERIIEKERPDGLLPTMGGQTGLNLAFQLSKAGILQRCGVTLLGTPLESISQAEDREHFRNLMRQIGEPIPASAIVSEVEEALRFAEEIGYPVIVRPAFTLGGTGGGIAQDAENLETIASSGIKASMIGQVLIERSVAGWKEVEYEVLRDSSGNSITVCHMENMDPVGVHTGDSIVVAPCQTLTDREVQTLRTAALRIVAALGIEGGCNVQFALHPEKLEYVVIEVNPRLSRSSALASKATGYPIAKVAAKIAIGYTMDELINAVTGKTSACFEPALDYVVVKIPRWPFDKFSDADRTIGTQMKATGEVMGLGRNLETALLKAVRSLETKFFGLFSEEMRKLTDEELEAKCRKPEDNLLFVMAEAFRRGWSVEKLTAINQWNPYFLKKIQTTVQYEEIIRNNPWNAKILQKAKRIGYSDKETARLWGTHEERIYEFREEHQIKPVFKMVDTCAGEFEATTPYFYSSYDQEDEGIVTNRRKVVVLGSGPIRIGQGIEFDYCSVHAVKALRKAGVESIIINSNPETVSTDFDTADRLYFEPLTIEDVTAVLDKEKPEGVVVQFGGQTAIGLCKRLAARGYHIMGTTVEDTDRAEERGIFDDVLQELGAKRPKGGCISSMEEAEKLAGEIGFPLIVRPSYVLGGRAMQIVYEQQELKNVFAKALLEFPGQQIWMDQYLLGKEVEVDAISDGETVCIPGIMEHLERAGIHSGDSIAVYPPQMISSEIQDTVTDLTVSIARSLNIKGLLNIQYVVYKNEVYVLEVNPRSSRTVPFLSKVTGVAIVELATRVILGETLQSMGIESGLWPVGDKVAVKAPVFSFSKLLLVEPSLGPEMKSTGEVMGIDRKYEKALYKALLAAGMHMSANGTLLATLADRDKEEGIKLVQRFYHLGFRIIATEGTAKAIYEAGVEVTTVGKLHTGSDEITEKIRKGQVQCVLNTTTHGRKIASDGFAIRRAAVEQGIPCFTSMDTAEAWLQVLEVNSPSLIPLS